ncbi:MAG: T9SS type A sorting domain-containing protein [Flavobacterium sp.]|nr:T9SS type A sorting domain-containing protein [Flavobacterium sp.]
MKKLYFLLLIAVSTFSFGQNLAVNGDFESWTSGVLDTWTSESGTVIEEESTIFNGGTRSAKITVTTQTQANTDFQQTINVVAGVTYDVSVDVYQADNASRARLVINNVYDGPYSDSTMLNQWQTLTYTFVAASTGTITIGFRFYDTAANWAANGNQSVLYVDNFSFVAQSTPSIAIVSPADGSTTLNTDVDVTLSVQNFVVATAGNGDGHINYMVDGGSTVMKYDTTPISLTGLSVGPHTVYVELVDDTHNPISPAVNATVNFDVAALNVVSTIAEIRNDVITNGAGGFYQLTGEALVTYSRTTRNQKYIQDATAAILIDDNSGVITNTFAMGDGMTGLKGQTSLFNGVLQILPIEDIASSSTGNTITPQVVTASDIVANIKMYESELVRIDASTFTTADGTLAFATNNNYNINDTTSDITFRTMFAEADYIGQLVPQGAANRVVLVTEFNGTPQVVARSLADVTLSSSSFNEINGLTMYPNPLKGNTLFLTSTANAAMSVQIFDLLGKEVLKSNVVNNTLNVAKLTAGVYVVKITEEGKTATRKLVVK